jgi:flagellar hook-length control protein FliK
VTTLTSAPVQGEPAKAQATANAPHAPAAPPPPPPQAQFAEANHPKIVTAMRGEFLPQGGTMSIRLDPPELGALQVLVHMTDGVMTASFQTSNDDATKLLSHSLSQLKAVLESQGVSVEKLQVQQSPRDHQPQHDDPHQQQQRDPHGDAHRQEQQRKEMLRRMWRKLSIGSDPLDLVA